MITINLDENPSFFNQTVQQNYDWELMSWLNEDISSYPCLLYKFLANQLQEAPYFFKIFISISFHLMSSELTLDDQKKEKKQHTTRQMQIIFFQGVFFFSLSAIRQFHFQLLFQLQRCLTSCFLPAFAHLVL